MTTARTLVFVGTYTMSMGHVDGKASGIDIYELDTETGSLSHIGGLEGVDNPTYLTLSPNGYNLYVIHEVENGVISAYEFDMSEGILRGLNQQNTAGDFPCHVTVSPDGKLAVVANYGSGSVVAYPLDDDGQLQLASTHIQHTGKSVNPNRQEAPHAHCVIMDAKGQRAFVADLGIDKIMVYDVVDGKLVAHSAVDVPAGAGVRHLALHPSGAWLFALNELDSTLMLLAYDPATGVLETQQILSTLPADFSDETTCAALRVHPSGRFVYASNRGHDSIACFAFDADTGMLQVIGHESTQDKTPRDFNIDPSGKWMLVANQDTDTIVTFQIDVQTGELKATGDILETPTPVCIEMSVY